MHKTPGPCFVPLYETIYLKEETDLTPLLSAT